MSKEQDWLNQITEFASNSAWMLEKYGGYCEAPYDFQRHHIEGRKAKRKFNYESTCVGWFYVIPVPFEMHDVSSTHNLSVTHAKNRFEGVVGTQLELFVDMIDSMLDSGYEIPFDLDLLGVL